MLAAKVKGHLARHKKKYAGAAAGAALAAVLIPHWEGEDLVAKHNSFDPKGVITVCDGVTNYDWPWLKVGMRFTPDDCRKAIIDLVPDYAEPLSKCVKGFEAMPPHRQAALISAAYNLGPKTVCNSTAVRLLNRGYVEKGCEALGHFTRANGKVLKGLVNRRYDPKWGEIAWCKRND